MKRRISVLNLAAAAAMLMAACVAPAQPAAPVAEAPKATEAPKAEAAKPTDAPKAEAPAAGPSKLLLSMKGPGGGNPFWAAVQAGAESAAKAMGVELSVQAPPQETDVAAQVQQVEDAIAAGVTGIIIAPTDPAALKPVLEGAIAKGIKVVFVDTKGTVDGVTFIGTNNEVGAALGADYLCKNVEKGAKVAILQGIITQSTGKARADGAKKGLTDCGLNIVAELPAEWDKAKGRSISQGEANLLDICKGMRDAKITVFTIAYDITNPKVTELLKACAPGNYYEPDAGGSEIKQMIVCGYEAATRGHFADLQERVGLVAQPLEPKNMDDVYKPALGAVHLSWANLI